MNAVGPLIFVCQLAKVPMPFGKSTIFAYAIRHIFAIWHIGVMPFGKSRAFLWPNAHPCPPLKRVKWAFFEGVTTL